MAPKRLLPVVTSSTVVFVLTVLTICDVDAASISTLSYSSITPANRTLCSPGHQVPPNRVDTTQQLLDLRRQLNIHGLDAYLVVMTDEHGSYSSSGYYAMVNFMSGFSGSNGYAVVTEDRAALWTDGRYFLQADNQMDCNWILMEMGQPGYPANGWDWLNDVLASGAKIGAYPNFVDQTTWKNYNSNLKEQRQLVAVTNELVGEIWSNSNDSRPQKPNNQLIIHNISFAGVTWRDKLSDIRSKIASAADVLVVTVLEQVAWLFNLRGSDKSNSLFYAYAIVYPNSSSLYITNYTGLISNNEELRRHLEINSDGTCSTPGTDFCVNVHEYSNIYEELRAMPNETKIWVDPTANYAIYDATSHLDSSRKVDTSPIERTKSIKNEVERRLFRECIFRDSAAVIEFAQFLEDRIVNKRETNWTELRATEKLLSIRQSYPHFQGVSFSTIAAFGSNAAVIHYRPEEATDAKINTSSIFLLDSGGQYLDGTTDVTRTFHFGTPTDQIKEAYTRVLMGQIDLAQAVWPEGLHGYELDIIARLPLHRNGWDYNHGTGHGIGYFLSVHEGPARIAKGYSSTSQPLAEGMFFSDEPGFYADNDFGIRLESLVTVVKANVSNQFGPKPYLAFETLTFVPYETKLIKYDMLSESQIQWLNNYNEICRTRMGDYLMNVRGNHAAHMWLNARTATVQSRLSHSHRITSGLVSIALCLITSSVAIFLP